MLLREVLGLPFPLFFKSADSGVCLWVDKRYIRREGGNSLAGQWLGLCASTAASCIAQPPGQEFEQAQGDSEGQGRLVCCSHKESDTTWQPNNNNLLRS